VALTVREFWINNADVHYEARLLDHLEALVLVAPVQCHEVWSGVDQSVEQILSLDLVKVQAHLLKVLNWCTQRLKSRRLK